MELPDTTRAPASPAAPPERSSVLVPEVAADSTPFAARPAATPLPLAIATPQGRMSGLVASLGPALAEGATAYCLDGGNAFDPLRLAARLRAAGIPPGPILSERLFVSRAFTCHQLAAATIELLGPLARRNPPPLVLILGVDRLFLDEDIPRFERNHLFERILRETAALAAGGLPILMTCGMEPGNPWPARVRRHALFPGDAAEVVAALRRIADGPHPAHLQRLAGGGA